jgi:hypothetical protein
MASFKASTPHANPPRFLRFVIFFGVLYRETLSNMIDYTKHLLAERRTHPRHDFLGTLVNARPQPGSRYQPADSVVP